MASDVEAVARRLILEPEEHVALVAIAPRRCLGERRERGERQKRLGVVGVGRVFVPAQVVGEHRGGPLVDAVVVHDLVGGGRAPRRVVVFQKRGGDHRDAGLAQRHLERRERNVVERRPLVRLLIALRRVELARLVDVADEAAMSDAAIRASRNIVGHGRTVVSADGASRQLSSATSG